MTLVTPRLVDISKAFDSIYRGKMKLIVLADGLPTDTITAIIILFKKTKTMVRSPDGDN